MGQSIHSRVLIVGAGPAGYTAAIYAARASLAPLLVQGLHPGGQLTITSEVENYPGFADAVQGPWLMEQMEQQATHVGARIVSDIVTSLDLTSTGPFRAQGDRGDVYTADTVVLATGAQARWLGLPSEKAFAGAGVSACATCDGFFFRGKDVAVVGGGSTAVEEALYLTNHARSVTVIHRGNHFRAERILQDRLFANPKVRVRWNSKVEEVVGTAMPRSVTGVRIRDHDGSHVVPVDGVFIAIGHDPATALVRGWLDLDAGGYVRIAPWSTATSIPGVFAAGDVADPRYRQAVTAAGMGCMAALEAGKFLAEHSPAGPVRAEEIRAEQMMGAWN